MIIYPIKLDPGAVPPAKANPDDTGYDLVAAQEPEIVGAQGRNGGWDRIDYIQYRTGIRLDRPYQQAVFEGLGFPKQNLPIWSAVFPRSSISKYNLALANSVGVIDHGYTGEILVRFKYIWQPKDYVVLGDGLVGQIDYSKIYRKGDKIAQLVPAELWQDVQFNEISEIGETQRGSGGFGSTGS